ncbi:ribonuclease H protein, partial [Trifolium medium]|nr:ribonuclease H protein [Trifolium medium]
EENTCWSSIWATGCHFLWTWRNREQHNDTRLRPIYPWRFIMDCVLQYMTASVSDIVHTTREKTTVDIAWQRPEVGWLSLHTDGASRRDTTAGCGGLLRNSNGQWMGGFSHNLGRCNAYLAELWGVFDGLRFAHERGATKVKVHVDSFVVQTLNSSNVGSVIGWRIIQEIRRLLALDWEIVVCHSYREANSCVDALTNMGCEHEPRLRVYEQCPARLSFMLLADNMGITT